MNFTLLDKAFFYFLNNIKFWDINNLLKSSLMFKGLELSGGGQHSLDSRVNVVLPRQQPFVDFP